MSCRYRAGVEATSRAAQHHAGTDGDRFSSKGFRLLCGRLGTGRERKPPVDKRDTTARDTSVWRARAHGPRSPGEGLLVSFAGKNSILITRRAEGTSAMRHGP